MEKMKAMLSQPMAGKSDEEIVATRERAIKALESMGYEVINTLFTDEWYSDKSMEERGVVNKPLCFLAKSLENMSKCHAAYFCKGWQEKRGCRIEHEAAKAYGMKILYGEEPETQTKSGFQIYIGVKRLIAEPQEKDGKPGYHVVYEDGYESWSPKDVFERAYFPITRPDKLVEEDIKHFIDAGSIAVNTFGAKTTVVGFTAPTGFIEMEASSCVGPANYDQELGGKICLDKITDRLWNHLGFVLQWADQGLKKRS